MKNYFYFGTMMVKTGHADAMVAGVSVNYPEVLRPALKIFGAGRGHKFVAGMYMIQQDRKNYFHADAAVIIEPTAEQLADITLMAIEELERMRIEPRVAMLSFSNFGSVRCPQTEKMRRAVEMVKAVRPDIPCDGPVKPDVALDQDKIDAYYPFADIHRRPNLLIFPNLDAAHISLRLIRKLSNANTIGPILLGLDKPIHLLPRDAEVSNIVNLAALASVDAHYMKEGVGV